MARALTVVLLVAAGVLGACGSDDDTDVGASPTETTSSTSPDEIDGGGTGDCAAHDEDGMCIDDPERSLYEPDPDECPPEAECQIDAPTSAPDIAAFATELAPACDDFQAVLDAVPDDAPTVGEALAHIDVLLPAFDDWMIAARSIEAPAALRTDWDALVDEAESTTGAANTAFRDVLADVDPERSLDEIGDQLPAQTTEVFDANNAALDAVDDFLGYDCLS